MVSRFVSLLFVGSQRARLTLFQKGVQDFLYEWRILKNKRVPFHEWADIAEEGLKILKTMATSGDPDYKGVREYKEFAGRYAEKVSRLMRDPRYSHLFAELMGD